MTIDLDFLEAVEGNRAVGYVPKRDGVPLGQSGVTIGLGFDLGQHSAGELSAMGFPGDILQAILPYAGKKRGVAVAALSHTPLVLSEAKCAVLNRIVTDHYAAKVAALFNGDKLGTEAPWETVPDVAQTVIFSVAYQHGLAGIRDFEEFWDACLKQDWRRAAAELLNFDDGFDVRREREADYLRHGLHLSTLKGS